MADIVANQCALAGDLAAPGHGNPRIVCFERRCPQGRRYLRAGIEKVKHGCGPAGLRTRVNGLSRLRVTRFHGRSDSEGPMGAVTRSEEHTSELQSLMRISYAVFCLKKKKRNQQETAQTKSQ